MERYSCPVSTISKKYERISSLAHLRQPLLDSRLSSLTQVFSCPTKKIIATVAKKFITHGTWKLFSYLHSIGLRLARDIFMRKVADDLGKGHTYPDDVSDHLISTFNEGYLPRSEFVASKTEENMRSKEFLPCDFEDTEAINEIFKYKDDFYNYLGLFASAKTIPPIIFAWIYGQVSSNSLGHYVEFDKLVNFTERYRKSTMPRRLLMASKQVLKNKVKIARLLGEDISTYIEEESDSNDSITFYGFPDFQATLPAEEKSVTEEKSMAEEAQSEEIISSVKAVVAGVVVDVLDQSQVVLANSQPHDIHSQPGPHNEARSQPGRHSNEGSQPERNTEKDKTDDTKASMDKDGKTQAN